MWLGGTLSLSMGERYALPSLLTSLPTLYVDEEIDQPMNDL